MRLRMWLRFDDHNHLRSLVARLIDEAVWGISATTDVKDPFELRAANDNGVLSCPDPGRLGAAELRVR